MKLFHPMSGLPSGSDAAAVQAEWDGYWRRALASKRQGLYERIARFYRDWIISPSAARILSRHFRNAEGLGYLHAGCGSGGSDWRIPLDKPLFHFLDISSVGLALHRQQSLRVRRCYLNGDLFSLPYGPSALDGIFNFGVMEHFSRPQIGQILGEFRRVLKPGGRLVLFWPPEFGLSVRVLALFTGVVNRFRKEPLRLHPDEISRIPSFPWAREMMRRNGFKTIALEFGWRDLFTYVAVIAEKTKTEVR